jgi:hypothetical protein
VSSQCLFLAATILWQPPIVTFGGKPKLIVNRLLSLAGLVLVLFAIVVQGCPAQCKSCNESAKLCGPNDLLVVCAKMGVSANLDEIKALSGYDEKTGTTLLGLQSAAKAKGLEAVSMKISLAELASFKGPAIAHLWGSHFVVVEPGDADTVKMTDPPGEAVPVKKADFQKAYSGFALLAAKDASLFPKPKDEGPDLRLVSYDLDIGSVYEGDKKGYSFRCRNAGSADLVISNVEASCSCIAPLVQSATVPPGGESEIKFLFDSTGERSGIAKTLYLSSNDPITPVVQLQIGGYVKSKTLRRSPREVSFGDVRHSSESVREVYVPSTEQESVRVLDVGCDSPYLSVSNAASADKQRPGTVIKVTLKPGAPVGQFKAQLLIATDHPFDPTVTVPIIATIKGNIDLSRDVFFLGIVKNGKESVSKVTVSTVGKDALKITKIDNPLSYVSVDVKPKTEGKEYVLTATLKPDAPLGNIKGDITIHTNDPDQPEIKIPVYAYVEQ